MLKSTTSKIYTILSLILVSLLLLPFLVLIAILYQPNNEVTSALIKDKNHQIEILDANGKPLAILEKPTFLPIKGAVVSNLNNKFILSQTEDFNNLEVINLFKGEIINIFKLNDGCKTGITIKTKPNLKISYCDLNSINPNLKKGDILNPKDIIGSLKENRQLHLSITVADIKVDPKIFLNQGGDNDLPYGSNHLRYKYPNF